MNYTVRKACAINDEKQKWTKSNKWIMEMIKYNIDLIFEFKIDGEKIQKSKHELIGEILDIGMHKVEVFPDKYIIRTK